MSRIPWGFYFTYCSRLLDQEYSNPQSGRHLGQTLTQWKSPLTLIKLKVLPA